MDPTHLTRRRLPAAVAALAMAPLLFGLAACGDDDDAASDATTTSTAPAAVTVALSDGTIDLPAQITGGIVEVDLVAAAGEQSHHLAFAQLNEGVTYEELAAAGDEGFEPLVTFRGGNGLLAPGDSAHLVLDLPPGEYQVLDLPFGEVAAVARLEVVGDSGASAPASKGTVTLGPGLAIHVPAGFDGTGVWEFTNADPDEPHEAALFALAPGSTGADVISWATAFEGPPPGDIVGGFGTLGAGLRGWADLGSAPGGGYSLVCFIPGADGTSHAGAGMVTDFSIS